MGRALLLALLLIAPSARAQQPSFGPLRVQACAPSHVVVTRPDGSTVSVDVQGGDAGGGEIADWWTWVGLYRVDATIGDRTFASAFRTYLIDADVEAVVGCAGEGLRIHVAARDAHLSARFIPAGVELEVRNDSDVALQPQVQQDHFHVTFDAADVDPAWSAAELRARSGTTEIWCGTGRRPVTLGPRQTMQLPLMPMRVHLPGRYRATLRFTAPDGRETFVTFEFSIVPRASSPGQFQYGP